MFCKNIKLAVARKIFLTIFSVAVLAFGFGALSAPEAQAVWTGTFAGGTIASTSRDNVSMCSKNASDFTVMNGTSPVSGAIVLFMVKNENVGGTTVPIPLAAQEIGRCKTTTSGVCSMSLLFAEKVKGDVTVSVNSNIVSPVIPVITGALKEDKDLGQCGDNCDNDWGALGNAGKDCADTIDCPAKTACKTNTGAAGKCVAGACNASTETFSTISADKASISVGSSVIVTFTANIDGVRIMPTVISSDSSTFAPSDCVTGGESPVNPKKCSITVTPISAGSITFTATKTSDATQTIIIPVNAADALKITTPVKTVTVGKAVDVDFVVRDNGSNALPDATVSASGAGMAEAEKKCTTDDSGKCSIALYAASAGMITIKAVSGALTPGSIAIQAVSSSSTGGTGVGGLTTASLSEIIGRMIDWLLSVAAGLAVLFMIIGGVYYVTAAGNDAQIETAKKMIAYSIIGLVFVIVSYSIVVTINSIITG